MIESVSELKRQFRQQVLERLKKMSADDKHKKSNQIVEHLCAQDFWTRSRVIALYVSLPDELDTWPLIQRAWQDNKVTVFPRVLAKDKTLFFHQVSDESQLQKGTLGILEPLSDRPLVSAESIDCVVVPGVAFDSHGHRLGRGAGYYDRFLSGLPARVIKVALLYQHQCIEEVPVETHDIRMDVLITESGIL